MPPDSSPRGTSKEWIDFSFPIWHLSIIIEKGVSIQAKWSGYGSTKATKDSGIFAFHLFVLFMPFMVRMVNSFYPTPVEQDLSQPLGKSKRKDGKTPGSGQLDMTIYLE